MWQPAFVLLSKYLSYEAKEEPVYPFSRFIDKHGLLVLTDTTVLLTRCVLFHNVRETSFFPRVRTHQLSKLSAKYKKWS